MLKKKVVDSDSDSEDFDSDQTPPPTIVPHLSPTKWDSPKKQAKKEPKRDRPLQKQREGTVIDLTDSEDDDIRPRKRLSLISPGIIDLSLDDEENFTPKKAPSTAIWANEVIDIVSSDEEEDVPAPSKSQHRETWHTSPISRPKTPTPQPEPPNPQEDSPMFVEHANDVEFDLAEELAGYNDDFPVSSPNLLPQALFSSRPASPGSPDSLIVLPPEIPKPELTQDILQTLYTESSPRSYVSPFTNSHSGRPQHSKTVSYFEDGSETRPHLHTPLFFERTASVLKNALTRSKRTTKPTGSTAVQDRTNKDVETQAVHVPERDVEVDFAGAMAVDHPQDSMDVDIASSDNNKALPSTQDVVMSSHEPLAVEGAIDHGPVLDLGIKESLLGRSDQGDPDTLVPEATDSNVLAPRSGADQHESAVPNSVNMPAGIAEDTHAANQLNPDFDNQQEDVPLGPITSGSEDAVESVLPEPPLATIIESEEGRIQATMLTKAGSPLPPVESMSQHAMSSGFLEPPTEIANDTEETTVQAELLVDKMDSTENSTEVGTSSMESLELETSPSRHAAEGVSVEKTRGFMSRHTGENDGQFSAEMQTPSISGPPGPSHHLEVHSEVTPLPPSTTSLESEKTIPNTNTLSSNDSSRPVTLSMPCKLPKALSSDNSLASTSTESSLTSASTDASPPPATPLLASGVLSREPSKIGLSFSELCFDTLLGDIQREDDEDDNDTLGLELLYPERIYWVV